MRNVPHTPQLEAFFEQHIQPRLASLAASRRRAVLAVVPLVAVPVVILVAANTTSWLSEGAWIAIGAVLFVTLGVVAVTVYARFREEYKAGVVGPMMKNLDSGAVYEPDGQIEEDRVKAACFLPEATTYLCEDLVRGQANGAPFEFANIHLKSGRGKKSRTVFHGFFFQTSDPRPRRGTTVVVPRGWTPQIPDVDEPSEIAFEDERIDETFEAFSTDPAEGGQLLSPQVMSTLAGLAESLDTAVFASFTPGTISVAAKVGDVFEPRMLGALVNRDDVARIGTLFSTARGIASQLGVTGDRHVAHTFAAPASDARFVHSHESPAAFPTPMMDGPSLQPIVERIRAHGIGVSLLGQSSLTLEYGVRIKMWFSLGVSSLWALLGLAIHDRATAWPAGGALAQPLAALAPMADTALAWLASFHPWTSWGLIAFLPLGLLHAQRQFIRSVVLTPTNVERTGAILPGRRTQPLAPGGTVIAKDGIVSVRSGSVFGVGVSPPLPSAVAQDVAALVSGFRGTSFR